MPRLPPIPRAPIPYAGGILCASRWHRACSLKSATDLGARQDAQPEYNRQRQPDEERNCVERAAAPISATKASDPV